VRHIHAASTEEHSALFEHYVSRNRLLTLVKNAPTSVVRRELAKYVTELLQIGAGEVLIPMIRRRPAHKERSVRRLRSAAGFARLVPHAVRGRREVGRRRVLDRSSVLDFASLAGRGGPTRADAL
jgi:2-keto-3-deoxy-L-rhamnonate aldolase RhmA